MSSATRRARRCGSAQGAVTNPLLTDWPRGACGPLWPECSFDGMAGLFDGELPAVNNCVRLSLS